MNNISDIFVVIIALMPIILFFLFFIIWLVTGIHIGGSSYNFSKPIETMFVSQSIEDTTTYTTTYQVHATTFFNLRITASELCDFINRENEINYCLSKVEYNESIVLSGEAGVGKTQFLFQLKKKINEYYINRHIIYLDLEYDNGQDNNHLLAIIEALLTYSWSKILHNDIMDLYKLNNKSKSLTNRLCKLCLDIQSILNFNFSISKEDEIDSNISLAFSGVKVTGKTNSLHESNYSITRDKLLTFISVITAEISKNEDKETLVVLCDEAKYSLDNEKINILYDLSNTIKSLDSSFIYIYSGENHNILNNELLPIHLLELQSFKDLNCTRDFIMSRKKGNVEFEEKALQYIHDLTNGHPRKILRLLEKILYNIGMIDEDKIIYITCKTINDVSSK